jgi:hypothetical protein
MQKAHFIVATNANAVRITPDVWLMQATIQIILDFQMEKAVENE